jgi:acyl transferase domain-containing protein
VPNLAASRVANRLDLRGPAYTVDAACASSLSPSTRRWGSWPPGGCDVMLAGGVHHCHDITFWSVFSQLRALSPSQRIRPFDRAADGC